MEEFLTFAVFHGIAPNSRQRQGRGGVGEIVVSHGTHAWQGGGEKATRKMEPPTQQIHTNLLSL